MILDSIYPEVLVNSVSRVIEQMIDLTSKQTDWSVLKWFDKKKEYIGKTDLVVD